MSARRFIDVAIIALAVAAQLEVWLDPELTPRAITALAALLWTLPLLLRRRLPFVAPAVVFATIAAETLLAGDLVVESVVNVLALVATFCLAGTHPNPRLALAGGGAGFLCLSAIVLNDADQADVRTAVVVFLIGAGGWAVGRALAERQRQAEEFRRRAEDLQREQDAVTLAERTRIAGVLHDVIAHSVSVMTIQAGAARMLLADDPERARQPLQAVEDTGHQALAEMRRLLGILRGGSEGFGRDPQPGIAQLDVLVDQVRRAGLPVHVTREGDVPALSPGVDLAVYRVVQEALTNVLKHAGATCAHLHVGYDHTGLTVEISDDGRATESVNGTGAGYGLVGMRERVELYGGALTAGPGPSGGYCVRATLPNGSLDA